MQAYNANQLRCSPTLHAPLDGFLIMYYADGKIPWIQLKLLCSLQRCRRINKRINYKGIFDVIMHTIHAKSSSFVVVLKVKASVELSSSILYCGA